MHISREQARSSIERTMKKLREPITKREKELVSAMESVVKKEVDKLDPIDLLVASSRENEYAQEIREITLRLYMAQGSFLKLAEVMYVVFAYKFDLDMAKPEGKYFHAAKEIMEKLEEWKSGR